MAQATKKQEIQKKTKGKKPNINIRLDASTVKGVYANMAALTVTDYEYVLDFFRTDFGQKDAQGNIPAEHMVKVILSHKLLPQLAKLLNDKLDETKKK